MEFIIFLIVILIILNSNSSKKSNSSEKSNSSKKSNSSEKSNSSKKSKINKDVQIVTPQFVYSSLINNNDNIILVNVLSDKMKYKVSLNGYNSLKSLSKTQFENLLLQNNNQIPFEIDKVIIYCASWSCNGAKNYYQKLINNNVIVDKVVDYVGAIHEWATYGGISPGIFTFHSTEDNSLLDYNQVKKIRQESGHEYFIENVIKDTYIKKISVDGIIIKNYL